MLAGGGYVVPGPDPEKPAFEIEAIPSITSKLAARTGQGAGGADNLELRATSYRVTIALAALGDNPAPVKGWRVRLLERPTTPELQVSSVEPFDAAHGRLIVHLARI
jgi:hypothetical protein